MEKKTLAGLTFLFLVLFVAQEVVVTEAKTCENLADTFRGPCWPGTANCNNHCKNNEHLLRGRCRDDFRCWCTRNC